mgnify:FL=1
MVIADLEACCDVSYGIHKELLSFSNKFIVITGIRPFAALKHFQQVHNILRNKFERVLANSLFKST